MKMSSAAAGTNTMICASCGSAGGDDIKLMQCACYLVKYCSVKCQKDHRPQHKKECKKRVAELKDEILFKQPENGHYGDCPICCLPLPMEPSKTRLQTCCSQRICKGCCYTHSWRELERKLPHKCPFCRKAPSETNEESIERWMKRVEANDPIAISEMGSKVIEEGDLESAFEYYKKAAALGDANSHYQLSIFHRDGLGGVEKDEKKRLHHTEQAAIGGHPRARHNLGCIEARVNRMDRAGKHFIIAAKLGFDMSLDYVKKLHKDGHVSKEDFAAALRGYQTAIAATKSPQREVAYEFFDSLEEE